MAETHSAAWVTPLPVPPELAFSHWRVFIGRVMSRSLLITCLVTLGFSPVLLFGGATTPNPGLRYFYEAPAVPVVDVEADVIVYGGTSGGVVAAVQAARMGKSAALVVFGRHVGGVTSGGLTQTDGVDAAVQGGITREFFNATGNSGFKPSKAEQEFEDLLADPIPGATYDAPIPAYYEQRLSSVETRDGRIIALRMENGSVFRGKMFIDCTYEGELLAGAGVSYTYGRESSATYGEALAGKRPPKTTTGANAFLEEGNPASGLIYNLINEPVGTLGAGDPYVQAYNFRIYTVQSSNPANLQPLFQPPAYDPSLFEVIYRYHRAGGDTNMTVANDVNNNEIFGPNGVSTDHIGGNRWPDGNGGWIPWSEADYATRERIYHSHVTWQIGMLWYLRNDARYRALATDPSLSTTIRTNIQALLNKVDQLGFAPGEYPETAGWPHELYVREGRRMVSDVVVTQAHCERTLVEADSVGLANYMMDSHSCRRIPGTGGVVHFEGGLSQALPGPWRIPYRAIIPKKSECRNLLVPWAISASHVAFCSMRMEPCFMVLSQSAATAAALAIDENIAVQDVDYPKLKLHLVAGGQILGLSAAPLDSGTIVDNADPTGVTMNGTWAASTANAGFWGSNYFHDGNTGAGATPISKSVTFTPNLPAAGNYDVYARWVENANRANNVPIDVVHANGISTSAQNQQTNGGKWVLLGTFAFAQGTGGSVVVRNDGANGYVLADAVRFASAGTASPSAIVDVLAGDRNADEADGSPAVFRFVRDTDSVAAPLTVGFSTGGSAIAGTHYQPLPAQAVIPAGKRSVDVPVIPISDSVVQGSRTVTVTVLPNASLTIGANASASVILHDKPFDGWRHAHFAATGEQSTATSDPDSDPDGDGLVNRFEFLLGSDPRDGAGTRTPVVTLRDAGGKKWLSLEYWHSGAAKSLNPQVQSSGTLQPGSWPTAAGNTETLFHDPATGDRLLRYSVDVTGLPVMFLRLALGG
jgi:hypothetical protein